MKINPKFKSLIPPLSSEELLQLEANIEKDGCRDPLVIWNDTIIDGHNRFEICERKGIKFKTVEMSFNTEDDASVWIIQNQFGRRNLSAFTRAELALKLKPLLEVKAKKNQVARKGRQAGASFQNSGNLTIGDIMFGVVASSEANGLSAVDTTRELAKVAGVSHDTIAKVKIIKEKASEDVQASLRSGEKSIHQAYTEITKAERAAKDRARKEAQLKCEAPEGVRRGDFREVLSDTQNINAIITDPPYGKDAIPLWRDLGKFAAERLAEDGVLIAYSGQMYLPQVLSVLSESLDYFWTLAVFHEGSGNLTPLGNPIRKVINQWKPVVFFCKKGCGFQSTFRDVIKAEKPDKTKHNWAQPVSEAEWLISSFTRESETVVDPFAGGGTVGAAAKNLNRRFIGAEILA